MKNILSKFCTVSKFECVKCHKKFHSRILLKVVSCECIYCKACLCDHIFVSNGPQCCGGHILEVVPLVQSPINFLGPSVQIHVMTEFRTFLKFLLMEMTLKYGNTVLEIYYKLSDIMPSIRLNSSEDDSDLGVSAVSMEQSIAVMQILRDDIKECMEELQSCCRVLVYCERLYQVDIVNKLVGMRYIELLMMLSDMINNMLRKPIKFIQDVLPSFKRVSRIYVISVGYYMPPSIVRGFVQLFDTKHLLRDNNFDCLVCDGEVLSTIDRSPHLIALDQYHSSNAVKHQRHKYNDRACRHLICKKCHSDFNKLKYLAICMPICPFHSIECRVEPF